MRIIVTDRLRLVPVSSENARDLWVLLQLPDLRTYQDLPDLDEEQFARSVAGRPVAFTTGVTGRFEWLIHLEGVAAGPVGWLSMRIGERSTNTGEVGYSVVSAYQRRGIATEAVRALIEEAFARVKIRRVRAFCVPENRASRAVLDNVGFIDDGILPHGATLRGHPTDVLAFVLEREHWEHQRSA